MSHRPARGRSLRAVLGIAATALLLTVTACGDGGKADSKPDGATPEGCMSVASGPASDAVKVTGEFGKEQKATFTTPLNATTTERTILTKGTGEVTARGDQIEALITVFLGSNGESVGTQPATLKVGDPQILMAFASTVDCVPIGSRVVAAAPVKDLYGPEGNPAIGANADDTVVIVTDVLGQKEIPKPQEWKKDVPEVTFDKDGKPTVTLPHTDPPKDLLLKVLKEGNGQLVEDGDQVTLDYQGTSWDTGEIFDQSYGHEPATFGTGDVVTGFGAALIGQKVGTRLVVSIPPRYAYGEDKSAGDLGGQTLVFVIEIKATAPN